MLLEVFNVHCLDVDLYWTSGASQALLFLPLLNWKGKEPYLKKKNCFGGRPLIMWKIEKTKVFRRLELVNFSCQDLNQNIILSKIKFFQKTWSFFLLLYTSIFQYFRHFYSSAKFWHWSNCCLHSQHLGNFLLILKHFQMRFPSVKTQWKNI